MVCFGKTNGCCPTTVAILIGICCVVTIMHDIYDITTKADLNSKGTGDKGVVPAELRVGFFYYAARVVGILTFSLGAFATYTGNARLLKWFGILISIWALVLLVMTITLHMVNLDSIYKELETDAKDYQMNATTGKNNQTITWDGVQSELQCCGLAGPGDWKTWKPELGDKLPDSCYPAKTASQDKPDAYKGGCKHYFEKFMRTFRVTLWSEVVDGLILAAMSFYLASDIEPQASLLPF